VADEEQSHYRVVLDDDKGCTKCGHGLFYTVVSGTGEEEMGVGTSWGDKEAAEDICDLMNMAFDAGVESMTEQPEDTEALSRG
jgi:hypothetical protein